MLNRMNALGIVLCLSRRRDLIVAQEALSPITMRLDLDDVGYIYGKDVIHTTPGNLAGAIGNLVLPPKFHLGSGISKVMEILLSLEDNYKKGLLVVTDRFSETDDFKLMTALNANMNSENSVNIVFVGVGNRYNKNVGALEDSHFKYVHLDSIEEVYQICSN